MSIRLLALDLDGTLLNVRGEISERNFRAVQQARERGVTVAVVTGRRFRDARPLALKLGLDAPVISHNGALTKHAGSLETVAMTLLHEETAREVIRIGRRENQDAMVSADPHGKGVLLYETLHQENKPLKKYIVWAKRIHGDEAEESVRHVSSLDEHLHHQPIHISFSGSCAPMATLQEILTNELGDLIKVYATIYPHLDFTLLDILNPEASKGVGLAAAASEINVTRDEVMAIGDNFNDVAMLRYASVGVVMGNADESLKNQDGFHLTATNEEDGVALAIEKFILEV
jgi:Cof subfamily protein (haloacid dehalogenase superfamily)